MPDKDPGPCKECPHFDELHVDYMDYTRCMQKGKVFGYISRNVNVDTSHPGWCPIDETGFVEVNDAG